MRDADCVRFLQDALPRLGLRWAGFRKVRRTVCKRIGRRLRDLGLSGLDDYSRFLEEHSDEWSYLDTLCRIPISRFYRDRGVFDALRDQVLPSLAKHALRLPDPTIRCWSAGCASGEEAYSLRLLWDLSLARGFPDVRLSVLGTDSDQVMLNRAARACYPRGSFKDAPAGWLAAAFRERDGEYCLRPEFRGGIEFSCQDIRALQPAGPFDLILCRNLAFTYFAPAVQSTVLAAIGGRMRRGGYLVLGAHERLPAPAAGFTRAAGALPIWRKSAAKNPSR